MNKYFDEPMPAAQGVMQSTGLGGVLDPYCNTLKARLSKAVEQAEQQLADARRAAEIFSKHPELEELLNILQKGRF